MKISIIGAGNVGSLTAMRLCEAGLGEVILVDVAGGLACAKSFDLEDAQGPLKKDYKITGTDDISQISGSDVVIVTAGRTRSPGMTREELFEKNARIVKDVCLNIKNFAPESIVVIITNPLDLMTYFALKTTGFSRNKLFGIGISLDAARFSNLISKELNVSVTEIEPCVVGIHGEGMLPLARFTKVRGVNLDKIIAPEKIDSLVNNTINRGGKIVSLLGAGSACFAPSSAILALVQAIARDKKENIGVCVYLTGEYGVNDVCIGAPCRIGKNGIEKIIELDFNQEEKAVFLRGADKLKQQYNNITI